MRPRVRVYCTLELPAHMAPSPHAESVKGLFPGPVLSRARVRLESQMAMSPSQCGLGRRFMSCELEAVHGPHAVRNSEKCGDSKPTFPMALKVCLPRKG